MNSDHSEKYEDDMNWLDMLMSTNTTMYYYSEGNALTISQKEINV